MLTPVIALACITVLIGLGAEWVFQLSVQTADQLLNSNQYIQAVLEAK
jgi:formate hydrogenlyase subunit 3/multisubunit Na+/H+ antiporter MnhD subunit